MKYVTEGIAEALYKRRINESVDEGKDWSGFKVRYTYAGDSLSDYESTCIVKAKDEKEAIKIAMKKVNADAARNFRIDGKIDSYAQYKKDFPNSGFDVFESYEIDEGAYDGTPTVAVPHDFSSQDWNSKKVAERIKIYLDYFEDAKKSGRKMKRAEIDQNFNKLERICLGIQTRQDYAGANQLLNLADNNGFVYKKYVEKLVNDLRTGKRFNLKGTPNVVEEVEDDITEALKVVKSGKVQIKKAFTVKEFDEDDGWVEIKIKPGTYKYQVIDFRGWKPRQLEVNGEWVDVAGDCVELEELLGDSKIDGSKKIVEEKQSLKGVEEAATYSIDKKSDNNFVIINPEKGTRYTVTAKNASDARNKMNKHMRAGKCDSFDFEDPKPINEKKVVEAVVDEARWVTMAHRHVLVSDDGEIMAGGPGAKKKFSSGAIKAAVVSANKKSKEA